MCPLSGHATFANSICGSCVSRPVNGRAARKRQLNKLLMFAASILRRSCTKPVVAFGRLCRFFCHSTHTLYSIHKVHTLSAPSCFNAPRRSLSNILVIEHHSKYTIKKSESSHFFYLFLTPLPSPFTIYAGVL